MIAVTLGGWEIAEDVSEWIEIVAILIICIGIIAAFLAALRSAVRDSMSTAIVEFKNVIAKGLLICLDLLIAADVIRTVTLELNLESVGALGLLVLIRTFLAWTLLLEAEHRWPWQRPAVE